MPDCAHPLSAFRVGDSDGGLYCAICADRPERSIRQQIQKLLDSHTFEDQTAYSPALQEDLLVKLEQLIHAHQLDLVDQFRDHIEGAYAAVEMAMGEAYYQITQGDKEGKK